MSDSPQDSRQLPLTFILLITAAHLLLASVGLHWWMPQVRSVFVDLGISPTPTMEFVLSGRLALLALGANGLLAVISVWRRTPLTAIFGISAVVFFHLAVTFVVLSRPAITLVEHLSSGGAGGS